MSSDPINLKIAIVNNTRALIKNIKHRDIFIGEGEKDARAPRPFAGRYQPGTILKNCKIKPLVTKSTADVKLNTVQSNLTQYIGYKVMLEFDMVWKKTLETHYDDKLISVMIIDECGELCNNVTNSELQRYKVTVTSNKERSELTLTVTQSKNQRRAERALVLLKKTRSSKKNRSLALHSAIGAFHKLQKFPNKPKAKECIYYDVILELIELYPKEVMANIRDYALVLKEEGADPSFYEKKCQRRLRGMSYIKDNEMAKEHTRMSNLFDTIRKSYQTYKQQKDALDPIRSDAADGKLTKDPACYNTAIILADAWKKSLEDALENLKTLLKTLDYDLKDNDECTYEKKTSKTDDTASASALWMPLVCLANKIRMPLRALTQEMEDWKKEMEALKK